ncbi:MAG: 1-deoxy-D-xylulose-5-phosphate reductoisomerase [Halothiobacillus sp. 28-55-5]|nr:MAG: 1-deoxy-D-xylulose-5-phosphate reductoisomerase [Halothiobacillus sp. 28-55-5]
MKSIAIFGSTGSIGTHTLAVIARHPDRYRVYALVAHAQIDVLWVQIRQFAPRIVGVADPLAAVALRARLHAELKDTQRCPEVVTDPLALAALAADPLVDCVVAAIVGVAGLASTWSAVCAGKQVLLANKESLVAAGQLMMTAAQASGATILPIDSEHNAIFQCLPAGVSPPDAVLKLVLTASGGPFRRLPLSEFSNITPADACRHPNWRMGPKISVDSATMMNKGLEVIEAAWLFSMPPDRIEVVVHPQSVIHSMVQYADGSMLAQLGRPDMRTPIAHALAWPERIDSGVAPLDLCAVSGLQFEAPDRQRFPCLDLAFRAIEQGGAAPLVLNAANEIAVAAFLDHRLSFQQIPQVIEATLEAALMGTEPAAPESIEQVLAQDARARTLAHRLLTKINPHPKNSTPATESST